MSIAMFMEIKFHAVEIPHSHFPDKLCAESLRSLIRVVDNASVCPGNPDGKFICVVKARKGVGKVCEWRENTSN